MDEQGDDVGVVKAGDRRVERGLERGIERGMEEVE